MSRSKDPVVLGLIQARMGSTRFPQKVLAPVLGRPMLAWQLERLQRSQELDQLVVATSDLPGDNVIAEFCAAHNQLCFRGSEASVLQRFYGAGLQYLPAAQRQDAIIVRLTGDCPLSDPYLIDEGIKEFKDLRTQGCRYLGYDDRLPDGMDFEVFTWSALEEAYNSQTDSFEEEHATPYMWRRPEQFGVRYFFRKGVPEGLRFSVDYEEDKKLVEEILRREREDGRFFGVNEITGLLASDADLRALNAKIIKNEGMIKTSLSSEPFQAELNGELVPVYGVNLPTALEGDDELLLWATRMGVRLWSTPADEKNALYRRLAEIPDADPIVLDCHKLPDGWSTQDPCQEWREAVTKKIEGRGFCGLLFSCTNRSELAEMLLFVCQKRFFSQKTD